MRSAATTSRPAVSVDELKRAWTAVQASGLPQRRRPRQLPSGSPDGASRRRVDPGGRGADHRCARRRRVGRHQHRCAGPRAGGAGAGSSSPAAGSTTPPRRPTRSWWSPPPRCPGSVASRPPWNSSATKGPWWQWSGRAARSGPRASSTPSDRSLAGLDSHRCVEIPEDRVLAAMGLDSRPIPEPVVVAARQLLEDLHLSHD